MQLYGFIRGLRRNQQRMIEEMEAQPFQIEHKGQKYWINWGVRPIQFVEHVFPRESLQTVLNSIPNISDNGFPVFVKKMIKSALKLKDIPPIEPKERRVIFDEGIQNVLIGIKDDGELGVGGEAI